MTIRTDTPSQVLPVGAVRRAREKIFIEQIGPTVQAILRHKCGVGLDMRDRRSDNLDALELYHDVMMRLWERMAWAGPGGEPDAIGDARAYAASVTRNAWSDHLRQQYPNRTRLKNRLRYYLNREAGFVLGVDATGEWLVTRVDEGCDGAMRTDDDAGAEHPRVAGLRIGIDRLPAEAMPARTFDTMRPDDWRQLLDAIFDHVRAPMTIDDLVAVCAALLDVRDGHAIRLDDARDALENLSSHPATEPHGIAQTRSMLRRLWVLVQRLAPDCRLAYLLNIPGPGKSRGDIEVLLRDGVATMGQIEASLALDDDAYRLLGRSLDGVDSCATALVYPGGPSERFVQLWRHLPLADALIARVTGLQPQQVINRRTLALRQLAKGFGLDRRAGRAGR